MSIHQVTEWEVAWMSNNWLSLFQTFTDSLIDSFHKYLSASICLDTRATPINKTNYLLSCILQIDFRKKQLLEDLLIIL